MAYWFVARRGNRCAAGSLPDSAATRTAIVASAAASLSTTELRSASTASFTANTLLAASVFVPQPPRHPLSEPLYPPTFFNRRLLHHASDLP